MDTNVAMKMLKNCEQFKKLKKAELDKLFSIATKKQFAMNDTIYKKGEPSNDKFCMIVSGSVKIVKKDGNILRLMSNSQVIGEIAVSDSHHTRTVTVVAAESTEVLEWDVNYIKEKMPNAWKNLIKLAGSHLSNFYEE
jgi:CRP-like cAMP-binding protein